MRVRSVIAWVLLAGCGPVELGDERAPDGGAEDASSGDGSEPASDAIQVSVAIRPAEGCEGCFVLNAQASGGSPPFAFEWDDGSQAGERRVCPAQLPSTLRVVARDANGEASSPHVTSLELPDAACPPPAPLLCLENPSFECKPAANVGLAPFDCAGWSACTEAGETNTPDVANDTIVQFVAAVPKAPDGETMMGLMEGEQVSQELCEPMYAGSALSLQLDLRRLYIGAGVVSDTELPFLEIWGGVASDCSARELLWASPPLPDTFTTYCAELRPSQFSNLLLLRAGSDKSQLAASYLLIDQLRPVAACP